MSEPMIAAAAGLPLLVGWSVHALRLRRRIEAARRDPLTGLWTRSAFEERAREQLSRPRSVVYLLDLNRFKEVNDTHGHAAGDTVIRATGERLAEWAYINDATVGRLGGDEFAAVAYHRSRTELEWALAELTHALTQPIDIGGLHVAVGASIGVVDVDPRAGVVDLSQVLRCADEQMYAAKRAGIPWQLTDDLTPQCATVTGRRGGRLGSTGGTEAAA
ncbi:GGDEF domain-containing protein [Streptomyces sp. NPDC048564]|uniref:GGDEF domain-containing protein n=1 Tax=Streptomyces sp. NPDC048564 TaxID=3155760 RepID=UPI00342E7852